MTAALSKLSARSEALVKGAIARHGSIKAVAAEIGYSRTALSLALAGKYRGALTALEEQIVARLSTAVLCPHLDRTITPDECRDYRERPLQTANPKAVRHWQACRFCPENPASHDRLPAGARASGLSHQTKGA